MKRPAAPPAMPAISDLKPAPPGHDAELRDYVIGFCLEQGLTRPQAVAELEGLPLFSLRAAAAYVYRARVSNWELEQLIAARRRLRFATRALPLLSAFAVIWYFVGPVIPPSLVIVGSLVGIVIAIRLSWRIWKA